MNAATPAQRFGPTSGTATGITGLACCALVLVVVLLESPSTTSVRIGLGAAVMAVLAWSYLLRPRIIVDEGAGTVELRNPLVSHLIPLAAVTSVGVKTVTTIRTADRRYDAVAVGYPLRKVVRGGAGGRPDGRAEGSRAPKIEEQRIMQDRVLAAADDARARGSGTSPVVRRYAVPEIAALGALALAFLVSFAF